MVVGKLDFKQLVFHQSSFEVKKHPCACSTLNYGAGIPKPGDKQFLRGFLQRESHMFIYCHWTHFGFCSFLYWTLQGCTRPYWAVLGCTVHDRVDGGDGGECGECGNGGDRVDGVDGDDGRG